MNRVWRKHACKSLHCVIDPDVAFWHDYLSPAWMHWRQERLSCGDTRQEIDPDLAFWHDYLSPAWMHWRQERLSLGDAWQEMSLGTGPLEKIVEEGKGIFTKRFILQLKHIGRDDCIWKIISSLDICETMRRNWFHVFFLLPWRHTVHHHPTSFSFKVISYIFLYIC